MKKILFFILWFGFVFASCKNTSEGGNEPQIIKHKVSFSVEDSKTGTLTAQIKGGRKLTTSPSMVENGKTIVFTATPNKDYVVESWFNGATNVTAQATNEGKKYELTVDRALEVKVKFKKNEVIPPPSPQTHNLIFEVDGEGGTLKAEYYDDGVAIPTSPATIEHGKVVMFTAESNSGYEIEKWTHNGNIVNGERRGYETPIDKDTVIKVKFKNTAPPAVEMRKVNFGVVDNKGGSLKAKIEGDSTEYTDGTTGFDVEKGKKVIFTATPESNYEVEEWTSNGRLVPGNKDNEYKLSIGNNVNVLVKFKKNEVIPPPSPQTHTLTFEVDGEGGTLKAEYFDDGVAIPTSPATVEHGKVVMFTAGSNEGYEIEKWTHNGDVVNGERRGYETPIDKDTVIKVKFRNTAPPPVEMRKVTFGVVDNKGGSLKAKVEGEATEYTNGTTGFDVEKGKKVIFTATPDANYEVEEWTSNNRPVPGNKDNEYKLSIGNNVNVLVKFKAKTPATQTDDFVLINIPNEIKGIKPAQNIGMRYKGIFIEGRRIKLSPYKMAKNEVTYKLWKEVKDWAVENGYKFVNDGQKGDNTPAYNEALHTDDEPVTLISWRDAIIWCNAYTEKTLGGEFCVYRSHEDNNVILKDASDADHCNQVYFDKTKKGFRLPTEAEWEAAARYQGDGSSEEHKTNASEYGSGVWLTNLDSASGAKENYETNPLEVKAVAWFKDNAENKTHPVGQLRANSLGLYDMSGNVVELCFDWHDSKLKASGELEVDPIGKSITTGFDETFKAARGSQYMVDGKNSTVGNLSFKYKANITFKFCGFRLAKYAD